MYIFKNACKSITRSSGRNVLIGIIVVVIAVSSSVALSIKRAAAEAEDTGLDALNITAQISVDRQSIMEKAQSAGTDIRTAMESVSELSLTQLEKYAKASSVQNFYYSLSSSVNASGDLEAVGTSGSTNTSTTTNSSSNSNNFGGPGGGPQFGMGEQGDFTIIGYSSDTAMTDFVKGTSKITSGTIFDFNSNAKYCAISSELATLNGLEVGDKITLTNPNTETETYTFTIKGIYTSTTTSTGSSNDGGMRFSTSMDPANQIYTSYAALKAVVDKSDSVATTSTDSNTGRTETTALRSRLSSTYVLPDTASLQTFKDQVTALGLSSSYTVSSPDITNYENSLVPLQNLSKFATISVLVVLLIGAVILIAFNVFNIRERKYEVGVLTAIGMKKAKVATQFITELFLVTLVAIVIGTAAGSVVSVPVADKLLAAQITSQQTQAEQTRQNFGRPGSSTNSGTGMAPPAGGFDFGGRFGNRVVSYVSDINASIDLVVVGELMGIGILLTLLSSCAAIIFIMRYEPLKILSERS